MNLFQEKRDKRLVVAPLRVPQWIRVKALELSHQESRDGVRVTESDVYRSIITSFFSSDGLQNVDGSTDSKADELRRGESEGST